MHYIAILSYISIDDLLAIYWPEVQKCAYFLFLDHLIEIMVIIIHHKLFFLQCKSLCLCYTLFAVLSLACPWGDWWRSLVLKSANVILAFMLVMVVGFILIRKTGVSMNNHVLSLSLFNTGALMAAKASQSQIAFNSRRVVARALVPFFILVYLSCIFLF